MPSLPIRLRGAFFVLLGCASVALSAADRVRAGVVTPGAPSVVDPGLRPRRAGDAATWRVPPTRDVRVDGERVRHAIHAVPLLPEQGMRVEVGGEGGGLLRYQAGEVVAIGAGAWRWIAPSRPGIYALRLTAGADTVDLTALVMHPATEVHDGVLNGYRIGKYRGEPLRGEAAYLPPAGFVEVGRADRDVLVSPHFALGDFLCKQPGEPRYVALSVPLLHKLETIAETLEARGIAAGSLRVMSGYRTPAYNAAIGNQTVYSRHLWGDAADVYVDADGDGAMDDLNGDGRATVADARLLARWIEGLGSRPGWRPGGLAAYRANAAHGPFVHVDARGARARW